MTAIRPDAHLTKILADLSQAARAQGRVVSADETQRALASTNVSPAERVAVVDAFLASHASHFSQDARAALLAFASGAPVDVPVLPSAVERFANALAKAATHGKVAGTITKGEAERALKDLASLSPAESTRAVRAFLASEHASKLSPSARVVLRASLSSLAGAAFAQAFGRALDVDGARAQSLVASLHDSEPQSTRDAASDHAS